MEGEGLAAKARRIRDVPKIGDMTVEPRELHQRDVASGVVESVVVPFPSAPYALFPQHSILPVESSAHRWCAPAARAATPLSFGARAGVSAHRFPPPFRLPGPQVESLATPSMPPSSMPQHSTDPSAMSAHV